ncbi:3-oxoacyl-[acyl-carrier protein] reductase [Cyclobacterium xiamenense]|uniref:3-oxoacyl-[acyl-carrier protein] reductase n=1 Tax=Cyclobacterium xiamenense TaxID=1297121 RepID=A0A1H6Z4E7_9BACT|nr:SDR family oxidoreductase [Cyclobacterium xiamenense]SEJ48308.1 3-oxoacyl-[acyl-carrier protein] reductase [Cyclobacterium xiamenense]
MIIDLTGYQAVVGGATRGLGLAAARQLAASGATVTLMARNERSLNEALASLPADNGQIHDYLQVDYLDFPGFKRHSEKFFNGKKVDILVNNTNGPKAGTVTEKTTEHFQEAFDLLFKTYHHLTQLLLPGMRARGYGRILNVSSVSVKEPLPNLVLSNSIRTAVVSWAKSLAEAVALDGVTVNSILTGAFDTERIRELTEQQARATGNTMEALLEARKASIPAGRFGDPKEYGYLLAFLASPMAGYITGTSIPIDGGAIKSL